MATIIKRSEFKLKDKIVLGQLLFNPPFKASQAMRDEARFVFVRHGKSKLYSPAGHMNLETGDSFIMKTENFVNTWSENTDGSSNEIFIIHFYPEILKFIYNDELPEILTAKSTVKIEPVEKVEPSALLNAFIESLKSYLDNPKLITDEFLKIKVRELILVLVESDHSGRIKSILSELFHTNEYEFKEIIHSHLFENLKLDDLAFFAGMSLSSFKRKFTKVFETSPTNYIKAKRLEKAENMLRTTEDRVSDIAYDCGFNDVSYFSKAFTSLYGASPSDYRKELLS